MTSAVAIEPDFHGLAAPRIDRDEPPCPYCGGTQFAPLYRDIRDRLGHVQGEWSFVRCDQCESAMLRPFPQTSELPAFYPPVYTFSPELAQSPLKRLLSEIEYRLFFRPIYRAQAQIVARRVRQRGRPPGKLLDIGCGRGLRLLDFRRLGYNVYGMDFSPDSVEYVQSTLGIPAVCTDAGHLSDCFVPESFDVVTAFHVVEHVTELETAISAIAQLLRPGGWLAIAGPLIDSTQARLFGRRWTAITEAPRHVTIPSRLGLASACVRAGFDPQSFKAVPDAAMSCAAVFALSAFPGAASTAVYGSARWIAPIVRVAAAAVTLAATPLAWIENRMFRRPPLAIIFAQKPN